MAAEKIPMSFSVSRENQAYVMEQVKKGKAKNSRYTRSQWGDDLISFLRQRAEQEQAFDNQNAAADNKQQ